MNENENAFLFRVRFRVRSSSRMDASGGNSDAQRGVSSSTSTSAHSRRYGVQFSASNLFRSPVSSLLEYAGLLRTRSGQSETDSLINHGASVGYREYFQPRPDDSGASTARLGNAEEVSIRIIGAGDQEQDRIGTVLPTPIVGPLRELSGQNEAFVQPISRSGSASSMASTYESQTDLRSDRGEGLNQATNGSADMGTSDGVGASNRDSSYQRYDIQQAARWIEQVLPFSLLLLVVFIRQHLQGILFFLPLCINWTM